MRTPAPAMKATSGASRFTAASAAATKASPTAMLSEPAMKAKSCTIATEGTPPIAPWAMAMASSAPVDLRAEASRSR